MPSLITGKGVNLESRSSYSWAKLAKSQDSNLSSAFSQCLWETDSRTPADTKIPWCLSPVVGSWYLWRQDLWRWKGHCSSHTKRTLFPGCWFEWSLKVLCFIKRGWEEWERTVLPTSNHLSFTDFFLVVKLWLLQEISVNNTGNYKEKKCQWSTAFR